MEKEWDVMVTAQGEYPPVKVECTNLNYARMISLNVASARSEMTTIYQYLYQNWTLAQAHPEISALTMRIAKVEMHHLHMLGELVTKLGGNPRCQYSNANCVGVWNGGMVNYQQNAKMACKLNINSEKAAFSTYEMQAKCIKDPYVSAVLLRIAQDEKVHAELWETCLQKLNTPC